MDNLHAMNHEEKAARRRAQKTAWHKKNPEHRKRWAAANPDKVKEYSRRAAAKLKLKPRKPSTPEKRARDRERARLRMPQMKELLRTNPDRRAAFNEYHRQRRSTPAKWSKIQINFLRRRAAAKGVPFDLQAADILAAFPENGRCPIFNLPFCFGKPDPMNVSVDLIIPALGYVHGNIAVISKKANAIKSNITDPKIFARVARYLREHERIRAAGDKSCAR